MNSEIYFQAFDIKNNTLKEEDRILLVSCIDYLNRINNINENFFPENFINNVNKSTIWDYSTNSEGNILLKTIIVNEGNEELELLNDYVIFEINSDLSIKSFLKTNYDIEDCLVYNKYSYDGSILNIQIYNQHCSENKSYQADGSYCGSELDKNNNLYHYIKLENLGTLNLQISLNKKDNSYFYNGGVFYLHFDELFSSGSENNISFSYDDLLGLTVSGKEYSMILEHSNVFTFKNNNTENENNATYNVKNNIVNKQNIISVDLDNLSSVNSGIEFYKLLADYDITQDLNYIRKNLDKESSIKDVYSGLKKITDNCLNVFNKKSFQEAKDTVILIKEIKQLIIEQQDNIKKNINKHTL